MKSVRLAFIMCLLGLCGTTPSAIAAGGDITLEQAMAIVSAARAKAVKQGTLMDIAVVDAGANLKAFVRMDGAFLGSIDISIKKAKTARLFNMPTGTLGELAQRSSRVVGGQALANIVGAGDREGHICDLVGRRLVDLPVDLPVREPD